jgi:hypothetical protein
LLCCSGTRLPVSWKAWMNSCSILNEIKTQSTQLNITSVSFKV